MGPQITLYVPHGILRIGNNSIMIIEFENSPCKNNLCFVEFLSLPELDGKTPLNLQRKK